MRIAIREQLALLILISALIGLAVISVATWVTNHSFVLGVRSSRLSLTASLKAAQLASNLDIMQTSVGFIASRVLIQSALQRYGQQSNNTDANWVRARSDMGSAVSSGGSIGQTLLLQSQVFPKNDTGLNGRYSVLNTTSSTWNHTLELPLRNEDGSPVFLGDEGLGYPPSLYPNLTYYTGQYNATFNDARARTNGVELTYASPPLLLGPWPVNDTFSLVSLTMPIINNTSAADVLGWLTVVLDARLITQVMQSTEGLGDTGQTMIVGPADRANLFSAEALGVDASTVPEVQYVLSPTSNNTNRHNEARGDTADKAFKASEYPAIQQALKQNSNAGDLSNSLISTHNEHGDAVSVGYAIPRVDMVNWIVLVEQAKSEVWQPINHLRDILIACVFATAGFLALLAWPLAHFAVMPIRRLREATAKSIEPPNSNPSRSSFESFGSASPHDGPDDGGHLDASQEEAARKEGWNIISRWRIRHGNRDQRNTERRKQQFRIPGKVRERKSWIRDELSDLTETFNEMSDELMMQYEKLEERVKQRTAELELSKKAAEAANESKTLFIANISHELKTPLNGILGMCAVCMQEDDPQRLKRSLGIIYKSGDLLLNLLTDLLTFSKNQVGHQITLDEREFRLRDISTQVLAIFDKQATEGQINFKVEFQGVPDTSGKSEDRAISEGSDLGPAGTGRIKDMILWGDTHRILQVVINLVSNSLKFTPIGGSVVLKIRCLPDLPDVGSRRSSLQSRNSKRSRQRSSKHQGSEATLATGRQDSSNGPLKDRSFTQFIERAPTPPPGKYLMFEFEVQDSGPGIPENMQQQIFEPFVQADLGLSKKYGGTGLGLSICQQLAGLMRGEMSVQSTVGEGSTFTMRIPLRLTQSRADSNASSHIDLHELDRRAAAIEMGGDRTPARLSRHSADEHSMESKLAQEPSGIATPTRSVDPKPRLVGLSQPFFAASQPLESPGSQPAAIEQITAQATDRSGISSSRVRVLVAEDNKTNQEVVLRMLKLEEIYDVTVARDGQEALDLVRESMHGTAEPFNLVLMDVQMPTMDGLQSTRLIREIGYRAPIVALTAFSEESNIRDCLDSGMNFFLSKPIRRPQLKKVLKEYCAPIAEEDEVDSPTHERKRSILGGNGTVKVPDDSANAPIQCTGDVVAEANGKPVPVSVGQFGMRVGDDRPISPMSKT